MSDIAMQDFDANRAPRGRGISADPAQWALFLDIDGTLLDMAPTPDAVFVPPGLVRTLKRVVQGFEGAVALSTGRRISGADRLFAPLKLVTSGVHGTEVRTLPGGDTMMLVPPVSSELVQAVNAVTQISAGVLVEQKGAGLAVHYRNAPEARRALEIELERIVGRWEDFVLCPGRKVLEILPKGYSKGTALEWLMRLPPFHGRRPIMIGDDHGDEAALVAAQRFGGIGLTVAGEHFGNACTDFEGPASVRAWLATLARKLEVRSPTPPNGRTQER